MPATSLSNRRRAPMKVAFLSTIEDDLMRLRNQLFLRGRSEYAQPSQSSNGYA